MYLTMEENNFNNFVFSGYWPKDLEIKLLPLPIIYDDIIHIWYISLDKE